MTTFLQKPLHTLKFASARQIGTFDFNFGLPTVDEAPLQPIKSGRGRPRKTPQRDSLPPPSSKKTLKAQTSTKRSRPSKGSGSNTLKRLPRSNSSETTKVNSVRRGVRSSSQPTRSDESGRATKKRRVNGIGSDVTNGEGIAQIDSVLPDIQESLQEDAVPEYTISIPNGLHDAEIDARSPLASKAPATRKRKKRKSITMRPRKRISVGLTTSLQRVVKEPDPNPNGKEPDLVVTEILAQEDQVPQEPLQKVEDLQTTSVNEPTEGELVLQEDNVLQEVNKNAPNRGSLPRRRKKRKSVVMTTKSKKRPTSPLPMKKAPDDGVVNSSSSQHVSQKGKGRKMPREPGSHQEGELSASSRQVGEEEIPSTIPQRRGRPPGSGKTKNLSPQITEGQEQASILSEEVVREDEDEEERSLVVKRRGRPPRSGNTTLRTEKVKKVSQDAKTRAKPVAKQIPGLNSKSESHLVKAKDTTRQRKTTKVSEKKAGKKAKSTKRTTDRVPITVHRVSRRASVGSEDDVALDIVSYPKRRGVNAIDVLGQICNEIVDKNLDGLEDQVEKTTHKPTRKALKEKHNIVQVFGDDLEGTFAQMSEAIDRNEALKTQLRRANKEKATAKADLLSLQKEVEEAAVERDVARMEHEELSSENRVCF